MSPSYPNQKTIKTGTAKVISFPQTGSDSTSVGSLDVPNNPFDNPEYEKHFKSHVESAVLEAWMKVRFLDSEKVDDPFDAIYLAELSSDSIDNRNLDQIIKFTDIEDLSDTVHFDDEWED
jgi:hypothetical protein